MSSTASGVLRSASILGIGAWIGITVFHGAVVVPTAHEVMGSHREIGFITRQVTVPLNVLGCVVTGILLLEIIASWSRRSRRMRISLTITGGVIFAAQVVLLILHSILEGHLDAETMAVRERAEFGFLHERYLNVTTVLAVAAVGHLFLLFGRPAESRQGSR